MSKNREDDVNSTMEDKLAISEVVQNWAVWRDAGDWLCGGYVQWHIQVRNGG